MPKKVTDRFNGPTLEALADDLKKGRVPLDRVTVSDNLQPGLRAIIRNSGIIAFHVQYKVGDSRPYLKLGEYPQMSIIEARYLAKTVISLAESGIDVHAGLHDKLIRELKEKGDKWRP